MLGEQSRILTGHPPCKFFLAISTGRPSAQTFQPRPLAPALVNFELLSVSIKGYVFGSLSCPRLRIRHCRFASKLPAQSTLRLNSRIHGKQTTYARAVFSRPWPRGNSRRY